MKNKDYFIETFSDGCWKNVFVLKKIIIMFGWTDFFVDFATYKYTIEGKFNFKYSETLCVRFKIGQLIKIKEYKS